MFFNSRSYRQHIRVENNILRREVHFFSQQLISSRSNFNPPFDVSSLPFFIERHYHHRSAVTFYQSGMFQKFFFAFFQTDGIDDAFPLQTLQSGFNHFPF